MKIIVIGGRAGWKIASHNFRLTYPKAELNYADLEDLSSGHFCLKNQEYFIGVGDNHLRKDTHDFIRKQYGIQPLNSIHPTALHEACYLGHGNLLMPYSVINPDATIGDCTVINTAAVVEHDVEVYDYAQIGPNATISGYSIVGEGAFIGSGAVILPKVKIGEWAVVGAGSTVTKDVPPKSTYAGCPRNPYEKVQL